MPFEFRFLSIFLKEGIRLVHRELPQAIRIWWAKIESRPTETRAIELPVELVYNGKFVLTSKLFNYESVSNTNVGGGLKAG